MRTWSLLALAVAALLTAAMLPGQSGLTAKVARADVPALDDASMATPMIAAVCAAGSGPCEDVWMYAEDGSCVTNLGRPCVEALADNALRRWGTDGASGSPRAGDTMLLEVIDERTLVVGYAVGADIEYEHADVVADGARVRVNLRFLDPAVPTDMPDGEEIVLRHPMLRLGREVITLDTPLAGRPVHISIGG